MHLSPTRRAASRALGPGQRWAVWLLVQALLALVLGVGPREVAGPLHWHAVLSDHHTHEGAPGEVARHHHDAGDEAVLLEGGAAATDGLGSATVSAAAALWPGLFRGLQVPVPDKEPAWARLCTASWDDADPSPLEHRPRS